MLPSLEAYIPQPGAELSPSRWFFPEPRRCFHACRYLRFLIRCSRLTPYCLATLSQSGRLPSDHPRCRPVSCSCFQPTCQPPPSFPSDSFSTLLQRDIAATGHSNLHLKILQWLQIDHRTKFTCFRMTFSSLTYKELQIYLSQASLTQLVLFLIDNCSH